jgi:type I restriction-modification system DNA methylase subunit
METYVIFVNDKEHAMNQVLPLLDDSQPAQWVLVGCPPRFHRHSSKWLTQRALKKYKNEWTDSNLKDIVQLLKERDNHVLTRVAHGPLIEVTKALKSEFGHSRVVDARKTHAFENLPAVVEQQKLDTNSWVVPVGAIAFGTAASLVAD